MKTVSFKSYTLLFIALGILSSCHLTGDFAIVKRKHSKGYYIQTPSFIKNSETKTAQLKKTVKPAQPIKPTVNTDNENLLASVNAMPFIETAQQAKSTLQTIVDYKPQFPINLSARDTIHKKKTSDNKQEDNRKVDWHSLLAFILSCLSLLIPILYLIAAYNGLWLIENFFMFYTIGFFILFALLGIIFGIVGWNRIKKNSENLKGKNFASAAIILGSLICLLWFFFFMVLYLMRDF